MEVNPPFYDVLPLLRETAEYKEYSISAKRLSAWWLAVIAKARNALAAREVPGALSRARRVPGRKRFKERLLLAHHVEIQLQRLPDAAFEELLVVGV